MTPADDARADGHRRGRRRAAATGVAAAVFVAWLGVYHDREFGEPYLFLKHRPSPIFCFHSPVGESDTPASTLPDRAREDEARFREFVEDGDGWRRAVLLPGSPCPQ